MEERTRITIEYAGGSSSTADVTFIGPSEAIMESDPMSCLHAETERDLLKLPDFKDSIELKKVGRDKYRFVRVLKRARFKRFQYVLSEPDIQSATLEPVFSKTIELGGAWERVFGGIVTIFIPKDCEYNPEGDVRELLAVRNEN